MTDESESPSAKAHKAARAARAAAKAATLAAMAQPAAQPGLPMPDLGDPAEAPRQGGRPAGTLARRTEEMRRLMLSRYRSPLMVLAETYSRPLTELAELLACTPLEAFRLQLDAAKDLAPYLHSKMPQAVQVDGAPLVGLTLSVSPGMAQRLAAMPQVIEGNQEDGGEGEA